MAKLLFFSVTALFKSRRRLVMENTLLRYQIQIMKRKKRRLNFKDGDKAVLVWFSKQISDWKKILTIVEPETIVRWHRKGFKLYWKWKYARYRPRKTPGQNWKTFLNNHMNETVAIDFFVVPSIKFKMLYALVVLSHDRREILHTAVTTRPSSPWTRQQLREAFTFRDYPKYLVHERDFSFRGLHRLVVNEIVTSFRSPWQNGFVERVIGTIRRECTDHIIPYDEKHLVGILKEYSAYYNENRTHLSLNKDSPLGRKIESEGRVFSVPKVGGLHHVFRRVAA
jgi:hypothetical protein